MCHLSDLQLNNDVWVVPIRAFDICKICFSIGWADPSPDHSGFRVLPSPDEILNRSISRIVRDQQTQVLICAGRPVTSSRSSEKSGRRLLAGFIRGFYAIVSLAISAGCGPLLNIPSPLLWLIGN